MTGCRVRVASPSRRVARAHAPRCLFLAFALSALLAPRCLFLAPRCLFLAPLYRGAAKLDGPELLPPQADLLFLPPQLLLACRELERERRQRSVPLVELRRAVTEHLLDGGPESCGQLLALLEVFDRQLQALGLLLDLATTVGDQRIDRIGVIGCGEQRLQPVPDAIVRRLAARPVLPLSILARISLHLLASESKCAGGRRPQPLNLELDRR